MLLESLMNFMDSRLANQEEVFRTSSNYKTVLEINFNADYTSKEKEIYLEDKLVVLRYAWNCSLEGALSHA